MNLSTNEENYLKSIYLLSKEGNQPVSTNTIADHLKVKPASITDMMKRLSQKELVHYEKYKGASLTKEGYNIAVLIIRKHRLWETFLFEKLRFSWDKVHEIAEQLEHIQSVELVNRLDDYLGNPKVDPHGDAIPNSNGEFLTSRSNLLSDIKIHTPTKVIGVNDSSEIFLRYLTKLDISLGTPIEVIDFFEFDKSLEIKINDGSKKMISSDVAENILVE